MPAPDAVDSIRRDVTSGASELVRRAADVVVSLLDGAPPADLPDALRDLGRRLIEAQPAMATMHALVRSVLAAAEESPAEPAVVRTAARRFVADAERALKQLAERADGLLPEGGRVMTHSASGTVRDALRLAASRRSFDVVCLEGRPNLEGRRMARTLADSGLAVTLAVDAAAASLVRGCDVVIVGADAIADAGVVNKIGTRPLAVVARRCGVPVYVLSDTTKLLPPGVPLDFEDARGAAEVWPDAPPGVRIWNRYFEATPLGFFDGVLTEDGLRSEQEIEDARGAIDVPAVLRDSAG